MDFNKIYTIKLNSGEEVIAKCITYLSDDYVGIQSPVSIAQNGKGIGLVPSLFTADSSMVVALNKNNVAMYSETDESLKAKYIEVTTGITIPDKKIILG